VTRITDPVLIKKLQHCGLLEVTDAHIVYKGYDGCLRVIFKGNLDEMIYRTYSNFKIAIQEIMAGIYGESCPEGNITIDYVTIAHCGNADRIDIDFGIIPLPSSDNANSKNKCPCCGFTL
jgi:hypothetical protein